MADTYYIVAIYRDGSTGTYLRKIVSRTRGWIGFSETYHAGAAKPYDSYREAMHDCEAIQLQAQIRATVVKC
jgi:hypothetical protein